MALGGRDGIDIGVTAENRGIFTVSNGTTNISQVTGTSINIGNPATIVSPAAALPLAAALPKTGRVNFDEVAIDDRTGIGIQIQHMTQPVTFNKLTIVANGLFSPATAVFIHDNYFYNLGAGGPGTGDPFNAPPGTVPPTPRVAGDVIFDHLDIQGTIGGGPGNAAGLDIEGIDPSPAGGPATGNRPRVTASILDINLNTLNTGSGTALFVNNAGTRPAVITTATRIPTPPSDGLTSSSGTIRSDGGNAVLIRNSTIGVKLTEVSSANSPADGIFLDNNVNSGSQVNANGVTDHPLTFSVIGSGAIGSGGVITASILDGVFIRRSEQVSLRNMRISGNAQNGVYADTPGLTVDTSQVDANGRYGINVFAQAVASTPANRTLQTTKPFFTLQNSVVRNNGAVLNGTQEVMFTAVRTGDYIVSLTENTISHAVAPAPEADIVPSKP